MTQPQGKGFKFTCVTVGVLQALLAGSMLLRDTAEVMAPFGVPHDILSSEFYRDVFR